MMTTYPDPTAGNRVSGPATSGGRPGWMVVGWQASSPIGTSRSASSPRTTPETPVRQACSGADLATVTPDTVLEQAAELMCSKASHRLPVVDGGRPAGIVSIGDLAIERDDNSALAHFSAAESNR